MSLKFKGQIFTTDAVFAILILFLIVQTYLSVSTMFDSKITHESYLRDIKQKSYYLSSVLMTEGNPTTWKSDNVNNVGLLDVTGNFDKSKIDELNVMCNYDYEKCRRLFGLYQTGDSYEFCIKLYDNEGIETVIGKDYEAQDQLIQNRYAYLDDELVKLEIKVYKQ